MFAKAKKDIINNVFSFNEVNKPNTDDVSPIPMPLDGYEITLSAANKSVTLVNRPKESTPANEFAVNAPITDPDIQQALANHPDQVHVTFRPIYKFSMFNGDLGFAEDSGTVTARAFTTIFGESETRRPPSS